jgi:UDP-N-acetyl-D-glucosamine dehydrogenase
VQLHKMKNDVSIIGHGYVGLPLALQFAKSGCCVLGLDIDCSKVKEIGAGRSYEASSPSSF